MEKLQENETQYSFEEFLEEAISKDSPSWLHWLSDIHPGRVTEEHWKAWIDKNLKNNEEADYILKLYNEHPVLRNELVERYAYILHVLGS